MQKLSSFRGKTKNQPKKSLTWLFHAALQLCLYPHQSCYYVQHPLVFQKREGSQVEIKESWLPDPIK